MAFYTYLDNQATSNDGTILGQTASHKISFYNVTPIAQIAAAEQATITISWITVCASKFGFGTSDQVISLIATVKQIQHVLKTIGIWKGSA